MLNLNQYLKLVENQNSDKRAYTAELASWAPSGASDDYETKTFPSLEEAESWIKSRVENERRENLEKLVTDPDLTPMWQEEIPVSARIFSHPADRDYDPSDDDSVESATQALFHHDSDEVHPKLRVLQQASSAQGGITLTELEEELEEEGCHFEDVFDLAENLVQEGYLLKIKSRYFFVPLKDRPTFAALALLEGQSEDGVPSTLLENFLRHPVEEHLSALAKRRLVIDAKNGYMLASTHLAREVSRNARERGRKGGNPKLKG